MQHEESFLHVTLTALSALAAHECCRNQLAYDTASARLLQRVLRLAVWPETRSAASRLLAALHPPLHVNAEEQSPAKGEHALQCDACNSGGDETALAAVAGETACPLPCMVHAAPPPATASVAAAPGIHWGSIAGCTMQARRMTRSTYRAGASLFVGRVGKDKPSRYRK